MVSTPGPRSSIHLHADSRYVTLTQSRCHKPTPLPGLSRILSPDFCRTTSRHLAPHVIAADTLCSVDTHHTPLTPSTDHRAHLLDNPIYHVICDINFVDTSMWILIPRLKIAWSMSMCYYRYSSTWNDVLLQTDVCWLRNLRILAPLWNLVVVLFTRGYSFGFNWDIGS